MHRHQLDHVQTICTSLQADNGTNTSSFNFLQAGCSSWRTASSVKALKAHNKWWLVYYWRPFIINDCKWMLTIFESFKDWLFPFRAWFVWSCVGDYLQNTVFSKANIRRWWIFCRSNFKMLLVHFDCHAVLSEPKHAYSDTNSKIFLHHFQDHVTVCGTDPLSLQPLKQKFCRHQWKQLHLFGWKIFFVTF